MSENDEEVSEKSSEKSKDANIIASEMLQSGETDIDRIVEETGLAKRVIYGIKGALRRDGKLPIVKEGGGREGGAKVGGEGGFVAPEEQMFADMRSVLVDELDITPGITSTSKSKEYILKRFDSEEVYKTNPTELFFLIGKAAPQIKDWGAREIVNRVFNVTRNYNLDRMKLGASMPRTWGSEAGMPYVQFPQSQGYERYGQYGQPQYLNYYTREQVDEMIRRRDEKSNLDKLVETVTKLAEKVEKIGGGGAASQGIIEETYTDSEGKQVTRRILPSGHSSESELDRMIKMKEILKSDLTPEQIRAIVRDETPSPGESPAVTEMKTRLTEQEKRYEELKDKISAEDRKRLEETIKDLRDEIRSRSSTGWTDDGMRVLNEGIQAIARKDPVKVIAGLLEKKEAPKEKIVEEKAGEGLLQRLSKEHITER